MEGEFRDGLVFVECGEDDSGCVILADEERDGLVRVDVPEDEYLVRICSVGLGAGEEGVSVISEAESWREIFGDDGQDEWQ